MKKLVLFSFAVLCLTSLISTLNADNESDEKSEMLLRHVVMFKFKDSASKADIQKVVDSFIALPSKIDAIHDFEWGTDVSVENKTKGFTHCFVVTFRNEKGREVYLPHPAHGEFVKGLLPILDDVLVVDYWTEM